MWLFYDIVTLIHILMDVTANNLLLHEKKEKKEDFSGKKG
jgi:hypothetical protein